MRVPEEARLGALAQQGVPSRALALGCGLRVALLREGDVCAIAEEQAAPSAARVQRCTQQSDVPASPEAADRQLPTE